MHSRNNPPNNGKDSSNGSEGTKANLSDDITKSIAAVLALSDEDIEKMCTDINDDEEEIEKACAEMKKLREAKVYPDDHIRSRKDYRVPNYEVNSAEVKKVEEVKDINNNKKPTMSLVPATFSIYVAKALEDGAKKRSPYNWRETKVSASNLLDKIERHLQLLKDRHDIAEDSGLHEMAHLAANAAVFIDALEQGTLVDDRPTAGKAGEVMNRFTKK